MRQAIFALALAGCNTIRSPLAIEPQRFPGPVSELEDTVRTQAEHCRGFLFGFIPLRRPKYAEDLIVEAAGGPRAQLVGFTVEGRTQNWVFGFTRCIRVAGWRPIERAPDNLQDTAAKEADEEDGPIREFLDELYEVLDRSPPGQPYVRARDRIAARPYVDAGDPPFALATRIRRHLLGDVHEGTPVFVLIRDLERIERDADRVE